MDEFVFIPERRLGIAFHLALIILIGLAGAYGLYQVTQANIGIAFILSILPIICAFLLVPFLIYRVYALYTAQYTLQRDGILLRWGLRIEQIPMTSVVSIRTIDELPAKLPYPRLLWPGSVLGVRQLHPPLATSGSETVEYLASRTRETILISTPTRSFVISPADREGFLYTYQRLIELGSLSPLAPRSVYPAFLLARVWNSAPARILIILGAILSLALLVLVSLAVPLSPQVQLGFRPDGSPGDFVPSGRLLLLPILNTIAFLVNFFLGLVFFRREDSQPLAFLLWAVGVVVAIFFIAGALFLLSSS